MAAADSDGPNVLEKVTAFVVRGAGEGRELLLIQHPQAGVQIPAGTLEAGETPEAAALREAAEETGLAGLQLRQSLGSTETRLPEGQAVLLEAAPVHARPEPGSASWARLRRGLAVAVHRRAAGFCQVTYEEFDKLPDPSDVSLRITGWVTARSLTRLQRRHFCLLEHAGGSAPRWTVAVDNHQFTLFWAPLAALPEIIPPQNEWLEMLARRRPD